MRESGAAGLLLVALLVLICLAMGGLQLWRAETRGERFARERAALSAAPVTLSAEQRDRESLVDRAAVARGRWLADKTLFLDNKIHNSRPGYHVLTPLQLAQEGTVVLVNRGWVPAPRLRSELPTITSPTGEIEVIGVTRSFETRIFELQRTEPMGAVWQHVRETEYRERSGLDVLPVIVLQTGPATGDGLIRDWGSPDNPAFRHYGYALMWLVFALTAGVFGIIGRRPR